MLDIEVTTEGFEDFINLLNRFAKGDAIEEGFKEFVDTARDHVIEGTPVVTGTLKNSWNKPSYEINRNYEYKATISNSARYGIPVNYGHRQEVGRYVYQINARLVRDWVPGTYFLENSLDGIENQWSPILSNAIKNGWYGG